MRAPLLILAAATAVSMAAPAFAAPTTVEHYYRIRWGSADEFKELYRKNHEPILKELQKQGFIVAMQKESPFTHMAGDQRWDLRVRITYRDEASAIEVGGAFDQATDKIKERLYPDQDKLKADEVRRFSLLEEHWDVIVTSED